jgi:hypothetical protein
MDEIPRLHIAPSPDYRRASRQLSRAASEADALVGGALDRIAEADLSHADYDAVMARLLLLQLPSLLQSIRDPGFAYDVKGQLVRDPDGRAMPDRRAKIEAHAELRRTIESIRLHKGLNKPARLQHEMIASAEIDERIENLLAQVRQMRALPAPDIVDAEVVETGQPSPT